MKQASTSAMMKVTPTVLAPVASGIKQLVAIIMPMPVETAPNRLIFLGIGIILPA